MFSILDTFFNWLEEFSSSPSFYLVIFGIAITDSIIPIVPSETMVIIAGVSAGSGQLFLPLVIIAAAGGAFVGDNLSYLIGRSASALITRHYERKEKGRKRLEWAHAQVRERGGLLLVTARFIPGGRTIVTMSCGITNQTHRWFAQWVLLAGAIWATYASLLGYIGGKTFGDNHTLAFLVAFGLALSATIVIEFIRAVRKRRSSSPNLH
ncbi:MAG: DedA family protein [Ilumatobacteraceae bacterium]|nr:DedA family protein [Ilumatobacteraceae bacterium]